MTIHQPRPRPRAAVPPVVWIGVLAAVVFAAGVGIATLIAGADATPNWMRTAAVWIAAGLATTVVGGTVEWALDRRSVKLVRKHIAAGRYRDAAVELQVYVKQLEKLCGAYDPLTLRWTFTLAHVLLHTGQRMRALALLALVIDGQMTALGTDHPDTRRSLLLLERHVEGDAPIAPIEIWWRQ
jgi:hypothetical protein